MTATLSQPLAVSRTAHAEVEFARYGGKTVLTRKRAEQPLKLLSPKNHGDGAWVFASSYGGGLVAGDAIDLRAKLKAETTALLATQSSTKVYLSPDQRVSRQTLGAELHDRATLIVWPDPVVAFARSRYSQHQIFGLAPSANLILLDWYTSGRHARGERWQASAFESRNEIFVDGKRAALDAIRISPTSPSLFGNYDCFATLFFVGPALVETAKEIVEWARHEPVARRSELIFSASALCCGGAVIRVGGKSVEQVGAFLQSKCGVVPQLLGDNPWSRKR